jgi:signal peptidase II
VTKKSFCRTIIFMHEPAPNDELRPPVGRRNAWLLFFCAAVIVAGLDLWTKAAVFDLLDVQNAMRPSPSGGEQVYVARQQERSLVPGLFDLEANYNYGAFNGWFSSHTKMLAMLSCIALLVIASVLWYSLGRSPAPSRWFVLALGLLAGGTAGNFYDRFELQAVRDWIKWYVVVDGKEYVWPNFNIADSGICAGVILVIFLELFRKEPQEDPPEEPGQEPTQPSQQ